MQGIVNRLATCSTDDNDNKDGETTRGHWLEHHEHSTVAPWPVMLVLDCFSYKR